MPDLTLTNLEPRNIASLPKDAVPGGWAKEVCVPGPQIWCLRPLGPRLSRKPCRLSDHVSNVPPGSRSDPPARERRAPALVKTRSAARAFCFIPGQSPVTGWSALPAWMSRESQRKPSFL